MDNIFDPQTGKRIVKAPPKPQLRQMLYHNEGPPIVVIADAETPQECKAIFDQKIKDKLAEGYLKDRPHGQHPHSFDNHRVQMQQRLAANGDKEATAALKAKKLLPNTDKKAG